MPDRVKVLELPEGYPVSEVEKVEVWKIEVWRGDPKDQNEDNPHRSVIQYRDVETGNLLWEQDPITDMLAEDGEHEGSEDA